MKFHSEMYWSQIKAFSILVCITNDAKSTKGRKHLLYTVIAKQRAKIVQTHPVYLHSVERYEKVESVNTQND